MYSYTYTNVICMNVVCSCDGSFFESIFCFLIRLVPSDFFEHLLKKVELYRWYIYCSDSFNVLILDFVVAAAALLFFSLFFLPFSIQHLCTVAFASILTEVCKQFCGYFLFVEIYKTKKTFSVKFRTIFDRCNLIVKVSRERNLCDNIWKLKYSSTLLERSAKHIGLTTNLAVEF